MLNGYEKKVRVYCKGCQAWVSEDETEFIDIAEDFQGADILTFKCHKCFTISSSRRIG